ncbi:MAG: radical SAM family heme chaperone HemW [Candidatus Eremiobacteraeota bacterium]|nr:radical SAM family heme chaperone HemW [Candidatus Eremiobacteraeota bacterium]
MTGIYVHLPFCPYICPYCDFAKWPVRRSSAQRYFSALQTEIIRERDFTAETIFLGGGTPNTYAHEDIAGLVRLLRERFGARGEVSIEINPELLGAGDCEAYVAAGINRISIGVQSLVSSEIATLGRKHTPEDVRRAVDSARAAGIASVSLDLIFAVPGQTEQSWQETLRGAVALEPDHLSAYGLTVEEGTPYAVWQRREPGAFFDDAAEAEFYEDAIQILSKHGYEHYEVSNFAKPGHRCVHNANYWDNGEYRGFGVGAASYRDGERWVQTRSLEEYLGAVESGTPVPAQSERLEGAARAGEAVMLSLRTVEGVSFERFRERYGVDFLQFYDPILKDLRQTDLLNVDEHHAWLTKRGRFLANDVCGAFVTFE